MSNQKAERNTRAEKGLILAGQSHVKKILPRTTTAQLYKVLSESSDTRYNVIEDANGVVTCDCEDFKRRNETCKHIWAVIFTDTQLPEDLKAYARMLSKEKVDISNI
jgi:hypothetical protein